MAATYTFDVFSSLDGYGAASGDWSGYWESRAMSSRHTPPCPLQHGTADGLRGEHLPRFRPDAGREHRDRRVRDPWITQMRSLPATVVSGTLDGRLDWPNATLVSGDAVEVVTRLKEESDVPLRSHGSLSMNRALMAAGIVDFVELTLFPVITGKTGLDPIFRGGADFDLDLAGTRTLDGRMHELVYQPSFH